MKKLIGTAMLAALLATSAFAEITMGAWLRVLAAPVAGNGDDIVAGMTNSWGWGARVARADIRGTSEDEKAGFSMQIFNDVNGISAGDEAALWVKPWDFLKVSLGHYDYTAFRGDLCYGSWSWIRPQNWLQDDEGLTFDKLGAKNGLHLELTPVEGLMIMWNLPIGYWGEAYKMFEQQDIAAKYTIADIGTIKLGWAGQGVRKYAKEGHAAGYEVEVGGKPKYFASKKAFDDAQDAAQAAVDAATADGKAASKDDAALVAATWNSPTYEKALADSGEEKYFGDINVAFDLTAVENLYITVGARISIASSDYKKLGGKNFAMPGEEDPSLFNTFKGAIGASYQILDNLKLSASYAVFTFYSDDGIDPMHQFGVGVDVGLTDSLGLSADFRAMLPGNKVDPIFSFLVGVDWGFSGNGQLGIGFQGVIAGEKAPARSATDDDPKYTASVFQARPDKFSFAVPIKFSYTF